MALWLIRANKYGWDDYIGFVIRADSEQEARQIATDHDHPWGARESAFDDPERSTCVEVPPDGESGVILESFNAG